MRVYVNGPLLRRRARVGGAYLAGATVCLIGGFLVSLIAPEPTQYTVSLASLLLGLFLWARNQRYLLRWGPRWRQDGTLRQALRALDDRYYLLVAPAAALPDYLLVGPMGVLILVPRPVTGTVHCLQNRWQHDDGRPLPLKLLLWFAPHPSLGNPSVEAERGLEATRAYLAGRLPADLQPRLGLSALIVFTQPRVSLLLQGCQAQALTLRALRSHMRRLPRALTQREVGQTVAALTSIES